MHSLLNEPSFDFVPTDEHLSSLSRRDLLTLLQAHSQLKPALEIQRTARYSGEALSAIWIQGRDGFAPLKATGRGDR